jgi:hypothetical protein
VDAVLGDVVFPARCLNLPHFRLGKAVAGVAKRGIDWSVAPLALDEKLRFPVTRDDVQTEHPYAYVANNPLNMRLSNILSVNSFWVPVAV